MGIANGCLPSGCCRSGLDWTTWALGKEVVEGDGRWIWGRGRLEDSDASEIEIRDEADLDGFG